MSEKEQTKNFRTFKRKIKEEYKKIVWPNRHEMKKKTITVITTSLFLGAIVFAYDQVIIAVLRVIANLI